ncbi:MAG: CoA transferase [Chloroflexi bacterium]|nr:CoA transferase [Chloroflexota bacterium]
MGEALEGLRVLDLSTGVAGPFCTKLLADYGAAVVKVEPPGGGDPTRQAGPFPNDMPHPEKSGLFLHLNTSKRSVTLDISTPTGQALLKRLLPHFQVVVESFPPGTLAELGLAYAALSAQQPALVLTSISPFGQTGPYRDFPFTENTVFALGGGMYREGLAGREPLKYGGQVGQYFAGALAAVPTLAAALRARFNGQGEWIDVAIMECLAGHPNQLSRGLAHAYSGYVEQRLPPHAPVLPGASAFAIGTYGCKDGYVTLLPLGERMWPNIVALLKMPQLLDDPRFATPKDRAAHQDDFDAIFLPWLAERTRQEVFQAGQAAGLPCAPVYTPADAVADPHFQERGYFVEMEHPVAGRLRYPGAPFRPRASPWRARRAPLLGEHNEEVYCGLLGLDQSDLVKLRGRGVI